MKVPSIAASIRQFIQELRDLPTLPQVAIRLIEVATDEEAGLREVSRLIESDQALASKVLRIANSAYLGYSRRVNTVEMATRLMGLELLRSTALSLLVVDLFARPAGKESVLDLKGFWRHSLCCGIATELLAERFGYPHPQEAFLGGLTHDLGKLVFYQWNPDLYREVLVSSQQSQHPLLSLEEERLGIGHTQAAKLLMEYWNFPTSLVMAAWLHHQPISEFGEHPLSRLAMLVKCANNLCHIQRLGSSGNPTLDMDQAEWLRVTRLSVDDLQELTRQVLLRFETISQQFDWGQDSTDLYLSAISRANQELSEMNLQLAARGRQLQLQQRVLRAVYDLQEVLPARTSPGNALEEIVRLASEVVEHRRLIGFLPLGEEGIIEVRLKLRGRHKIERVLLPLPPEASRPLTRLKPREQVALIEAAVKELGEEDLWGREIRQALQNGDLTVFPLETVDATIGQILVEPDAEDWQVREKLEWLRHFVRVAAQALERVLLIEALDQQAENLARLARKSQEAQARLYQVERLASVGRLAAGAAHEINNPLATISLQAQLLLDQVSEEKVRKPMQLIISQCQRIAKIIGDLMGFAQPAEPKLEGVDLRELLEHTLELLGNRLSAGQIEVRKEFLAADTRLQADPRQLEQVFFNLILNAIQAMPGGGTLSLRVRDREKPEGLLVELTDTGSGIAPEALPSIFDPFFTTRRVGEGTGLGLAVSHAIVKSHQGEISVQSHPGQGTTFRVFLPRFAPQSSLGGDIPPAKRILLIEDDKVMAQFLRDSLSHAGYQVKVMAPSDLDRTAPAAVDLVVVELRGAEREESLLGELSTMFPSTPVLALAPGEAGVPPGLGGQVRVLRKPFAIQSVLRCIEEMLR